MKFDLHQSTLRMNRVHSNWRKAAASRRICDSPSHDKRRREMLETIAVVLIVLWLLGFVSSYTMGGFIHILLVLAVVVILIRLIQGRRV
jgi:hypothetical protein